MPSPCRHRASTIPAPCQHHVTTIDQHRPIRKDHARWAGGTTCWRRRPLALTRLRSAYSSRCGDSCESAASSSDPSGSKTVWDGCEPAINSFISTL